MAFATPAFAVTIEGLFVVVSGLQSAAEGYEDEQGFHILRKHSRGSGVRRAAKQVGRADPWKRNESGVSPYPFQLAEMNFYNG